MNIGVWVLFLFSRVVVLVIGRWSRRGSGEIVENSAETSNQTVEHVAHSFERRWGIGRGFYDTETVPLELVFVVVHNGLAGKEEILEVGPGDVLASILRVREDAEGVGHLEELGTPLVKDGVCAMLEHVKKLVEANAGHEVEATIDGQARQKVGAREMVHYLLDNFNGEWKARVEPSLAVSFVQQTVLYTPHQRPFLQALQ